MTAEARAPAKLNLTLHVTGRRADGYHRLDSLVAFAGEIGDTVRAEPAGALSLSVTGPMAAAVPGAADNLVLRAADWLAPGRGAALTLDKHLPVAAGLGGGSADAAAALRALAAGWGLPVPAPGATAALGADLPVCLQGRAARMRGIGDDVAPCAGLPAVFAVLANPGVGLATGEVFAGLSGGGRAPMPDPLPAFRGVESLLGFLRCQRNDLEAPARRLAPVIGSVLDALAATPGCALARMSGSGATCFGLYPERPAADAAAARLARAQPGWWVRASRLS